MRYAGIQNNRIRVVSSSSFISQDLTVIEVSKSLDGVSDEELMLSYRVRNNQLTSIHSKKAVKELKVALVSNYRQRCGISTYFEYLMPLLVKQLGDFRLFVEENDKPTGEFQYPDKTVVCWRRGEPTDRLVKAIKEYDPDIVWFNQEWGLFPNACNWLSMLTQLSEYRIITTLHSVFPEHLDKTICEAAIPEIVVHLEGAKEALEKKGVRSKIKAISHGCYPVSNEGKLWNMYRSPNTFLQVGFGFKYKGMPTSIKAAAILKKKYADVFLTILFSESHQNKVGHQMYYDELIRLINELGMQNNIAIIRGYQSDEVIDSYFRTNTIAVFPYESEPGHLVWGSSGAARLAMSRKVPVISSSIPHFSDLPTIKADTPEQIAHELDILFSDTKKQAAQIQKQLDYIKENSWEKVAQKYIDIFENGY